MRRFHISLFSVCILLLSGSCRPAINDNLPELIFAYSLLNTTAELQSLSVSAGNLSPAFDPDITEYTLELDIKDSNVYVKVESSQSSDAILVNGNATPSGQYSSGLPMNVGTDTIEVKITKDHGLLSRTYNINVSRNTWAQQAYVKASNTGNNDFFGSSVAIYDDTMVVGALREDSDGTGVVLGSGFPGNNNNAADGSGAAYVFVRDAHGNWSQQAFLKAPSVVTAAEFGASVAIDGDTIVVGALYNVGGVAYVYVREGSAWSLQTALTASNAEDRDGFGHRVRISGDTIVVGAPYEDGSLSGVINGPDFSGIENNDLDRSGAAYVFKRTGIAWTQEAYLKAANPDSSDGFGYSVAISENAIVVGAQGEDSDATGVTDGSGFYGNDGNGTDLSGAAYVFLRDGSTWRQQAYLKPVISEYDTRFGFSVAISGQTIVVGAIQDRRVASGVTNGSGYSGETGDQSGAAYVFVREGVFWRQQAFLKASNNSSGQLFGISVAIDGDLIVVGSNGESANGIGVTNGNGYSGTDNYGNNQSGAASVFIRENSSWRQHAYFKAPNPGSRHEFGAAVAIHTDSIAVGAYQEDSDATGVTNGSGFTQNGSISRSGAVYVFH